MAMFYTWAFQNSLVSKSRFNSWEKHILSCAHKIMLEVRNPGGTGIRRAGKLHILCSVSAWTINRPKQTGLGVERKSQKAYVFICETEKKRRKRGKNMNKIGKQKALRYQPRSLYVYIEDIYSISELRGW